jgi:hypothetical protein
MRKRIIILTPNACYLSKTNGNGIVTVVTQNFFDDSIEINAYNVNSLQGRVYCNYPVWLETFNDLGSINPVLFSKEMIERKEVENDDN